MFFLSRLRIFLQSLAKDIHQPSSPGLPYDDQHVIVASIHFRYNDYRKRPFRAGGRDDACIQQLVELFTHYLVVHRVHNPRTEVDGIGIAKLDVMLNWHFSRPKVVE